ncbi:Oxidoreductase molybdopterin binding domain protein [Sporotomaculum syntrophicum]|uniref:Oxidoreductase molybdopterin binding domain protein n=1 Tax=Sporotomaculum syntrophicum TaxID=182264 RepID=A0A9D2WN36_9FIRM|nr:molybdopterin-dependent oxidoreductase [Sporotomaculum syntrophicum]KAF1083796.1 Oxidoreductase molybdopterin binding domain protein [Sporotomaculum syntrophicum]
MDINNKLVYWSIGLLLVLAVVLTYLYTPNSRESANLTVSCKGEPVKTFTIEQIKEMPAVDRRVTIRSSSEGTQTHVFTGTPLREILTDLENAVLTDTSKVTASGLDSYTVVFDSEEIMSRDHVLLVYAQDGKPLGSKSEGGTGPFRIIVIGDQFGLRAVKYVNELEIN